MQLLKMMLLIGGMLSFNACGDDPDDDTAAVPVEDTAPTAEQIALGTQLYADNCADCHGALASSTKANRTAVQITNALANISNMSGISLEESEITAIAAALIQE